MPVQSTSRISKLTSFLWGGIESVTEEELGCTLFFKGIMIESIPGEKLI